MSPLERDEFKFALSETLEFYGKTLDDTQLRFWWSVMGDRDVRAIKAALNEYLKVGKYAPKPAHIMELMAEYKTTKDYTPKPPLTTSCPPEIAKAWTWFIGQHCGDMGLFERQDIPVELQEKYLHIVNHEARKYDNPDAIPDEYKLAEVWG